MRLEFDPAETIPRQPAMPNRWTATTDRGGYVGSGVTALDAVADLVVVLESALGERSS